MGQIGEQAAAITGFIVRALGAPVGQTSYRL